MAPLTQWEPSSAIPILSRHIARSTQLDNDWRQKSTPQEALIVESWSQGCMLGALMIMAGITVANMRRGVLLHRLILLELLLALTHGTFCFFSFNGYGWYLSSTAALLYSSYWLHNVVAWMKIKPFLTRKWSMFYIGTVCLVIPCLIFQIFNNYRFFNNLSDLYQKVRPYEPLFRDPWWVFTTIYLVWVIHTHYDIPFGVLFRRGPRFGIMLVSMAASLAFICVDVVSTVVPHFSSTVGINPYWKFALVFKCFCDTIILDDFKTALEKLRRGIFETMDTVRFDDGEDTGLGRQRRGGVDSGAHRPSMSRVRTMSTQLSPTDTYRKSWRPRFGSISTAQGESHHLERADSSEQTHCDLNDEDVKEELEIDTNSRASRADEAREQVGKVPKKLAQLPGLKGLGVSLRRQSTQVNGSLTRGSTPPESTTYSSMHRHSTQGTTPLESSRQRSVPDPHHIPTDEELETDPTGTQTFEQRRRLQTSIDVTAIDNGQVGPSSSPPHPGQPWGHFDEDHIDEPWGMNQAEKAKAKLKQSQTSSTDLEAGPVEDEKISFMDAL